METVSLAAAAAAASKPTNKHPPPGAPLTATQMHPPVDSVRLLVTNERHVVQSVKYSHSAPLAQEK